MKGTLITLISFCLSITFLSLTGCEIIEDVACKKGEGARTTQERDLQNFSEILIDMPGDVYITQGTEFVVNVTAQDNLQDEISTTINGEILEIVNESCLGNHKTIRVDITLPTLLALEVRNSGDVYGQTPFTSDALSLIVDGSGGIELEATTGKANIFMDGSGNIAANLEASILSTNIDGTGDVQLEGSVDAHNITTNRSGNILAFELMSKESTVVIDGRGNCEISVQDSLNVTIKSSGDVFYKGNPTIAVDISGSGDLKDAN